VAEPEPTLTLPDIATLAGVQRAVVSMWRRRPRARGQLMPFPDPVPPAGPVERFRRDEIVEWLTRTGRGNNTEHRLDAPALSAPVGVALEDLVTLLCLYTHGDGDSELADLTSAERERLARRIDPADEFLLTEVGQLSATDEALRFVDDLVEASLGLADALSRLEHGAAGRALGRRELTAQALTLAAAVTQALAMHLDADGVPVAFAGGPPGLALAVASAGRHLGIEGNGQAERALRRRAAIHGLDITDANVGPRVRVLSVLGSTSDATLTRVDDLVLDLGPREVGLVIGPAAALCDRLRGDDERNRATTLRLRRLVAAVRLPRGMWREAHRQALGLWICAGDQTIDRPMIADLGGFPPAELSVEDLAADVSGALSATPGRAFRYLRSADLPAILTGTPLVPMGARAPRWETPSHKHLDQVQAAALVTAEPLAPFDILVTAAPGAVLLRRRSLEELHEAGALVMRRGRRIDPHHAVPDGSVPVLGLHGMAEGLALDPFDAECLYPRAHRTEPGDVVFAEGAPPRALVDTRGGALVASPSRILRLGPGAGVGPHTLAAIINHQARTGGWQTWSVPLLDPAAAATLEVALAQADTYGVALRRRQDALHDLITALIEGVGAGDVSVVPSSDNQKGP
jgi:hypothetical protein